MTRKYGIGLDIGIGYIGFAVIAPTSNVDACVEDFGVRFFDSGETADHKARKSHERRVYRNFRRMVRRRVHRKERVKAFLQKINFVSDEQLRLWREKHGDQNIFAVRLKGLSEKLAVEEITDLLIHICNHRGYSEYYNEEISSKDAGLVKAGLAAFEERFQTGQYRSVADMVLHDEAFKTETSFPDYHNHKNSGRYVLIKRAYIRKELLDILHTQSKYYHQLTEGNINFLCDKIVFAQRDFESGPGDENDKERKFMSFLDSIGRCRFYKEEKRAFRTTVIGDVYALVNHLSQYTYVNEENNKVILPQEVAKTILDYALREADISEREVKAILKGFGLKLVRKIKSKVKLADTVATLRILKTCLEKSGCDYEELLSEEQFNLDAPSRLQKLSLLLCENITPKRRERILKANGYNDSLCKALQHKSFGGTVDVCERYMVDVIKCFLRGEAITNVKARLLLKRSSVDKGKKQKILPAFTKATDEELVRDVVAFKLINEVRKVTNAIIRKYGSPAYINVEIADEVGLSFKERQKLARLNRAGRKEVAVKNKGYIARYIASYLEDNLYFADGENKKVYLAKSSTASAMSEQILKSGCFAYLGNNNSAKLLCAVNAVALASSTAGNEQRYKNITFAEGLQMPLVSYKQNKKFQGQFTDDNPIDRKKRKPSSIVKLDEYGNETVLSASKYYCVEIYKDWEKRTALRGIRYVDLVKRDKKLYLAVPYPENYLEHVMYLFPNDYIKICDAKGNEKFAGFYRSVKAVTRNLLNVRKVHAEEDEYVYVTQKDVFKKYDVDILGRIGGEVKSFVPLGILPQED